MLMAIDVHKDLLKKYLPEYTIDGDWPIGTGTWAIVYKGSGKIGPVAIKFLDKYKVQYEEMLIKAREEVRYLVSLMQQNEPNIIQIYANHESQQYLITVLELGHYSLSDALMNYYRGGMSENLAKSIFFQILSGVIALHKLNIIHRDLKLENIVVILAEGQLQQDKTYNNTKLLLNSTIKIIDLGVCKKLEHQDELTTTMAGTISTMAPEVRDGSQGHTCSADIFSLGVLLIQLLIGHLPPANFYEAYVYRSEFKGKISAEIDKILISLLDHNPNSRPSAKELLNRLASWKQQPKARISLVETINSNSQPTDVENKGIGNQASDPQQDQLIPINRSNLSAPTYNSTYEQSEESKSEINAQQHEIENNSVHGQNQQDFVALNIQLGENNGEETHHFLQDLQIQQQKKFISRGDQYAENSHQQFQDNQNHNSAPTYESKSVQCEESKSEINAQQHEIQINVAIEQNQKGNIPLNIDLEEETYPFLQKLQNSQQQKFISRRDYYLDVYKLGKVYRSLRQHYKIDLFENEENQFFYFAKTLSDSSFSDLKLTEHQKILIESDRKFTKREWQPTYFWLPGLIPSLLSFPINIYFILTTPAKPTLEQVENVLVYMMSLHHRSHPISDGQVRWLLLQGISLAFRIYIHMGQNQPDTYKSTFTEENERNIHLYIERNLDMLNRISTARSQTLQILYKLLIKDELSVAQTVP